jgi:signal transduction histidine kinase
MEMSVEPRIVPELVLGGIPRSRLPLLLVLLLTMIAVLTGVFFLLRREHHLAEARADFVSGVSHELRTPLTQIRMFAETLLFDRARSDDERMRSLRIINEEARRLTNLVDNVLFMSRRQGALGENDRCDIEVTTGDAVDAFMPLAMRSDVAITSDLQPRLEALIDGETWKQVVTNILDNAVKYGPEGQTVRVTVTGREGMVRLCVDDEGPGIPAGERARIWQRFHRLDRDRGTHKTGSGIGLAIVRTIVKRHHGRCWVEGAPGGGARFIVEVPSARRDAST